MSAANDKEREINDFKNVIAQLLLKMNKTTTMKEFIKAYREEQGHNINVVLDKVEIKIIFQLFVYISIFTAWAWTTL